MGSERPEFSNQAVKLLETGSCDLPVDWSDIADRVRRHPNFEQALKSMYQKGPSQILKLIIEVSALKLCEEFSVDENKSDNLPDSGVINIRS